MDKIDISDQALNLAGKFLIATPNMQDPRFHRAVIYMCNHTSEGAMGLIINQTKSDIWLSEMLGTIGIDGAIQVADSPVLTGGPVDIDRGFILHSPDFISPENSNILSKSLTLTSTKDVLTALVSETDAPEKAVLMVGYSGWSGGQLERELQQNAWLVVDGDEAMIFDSEIDTKWARALAIIGVTPAMLSTLGGTA
ncbi:MAG: YqgE/AlgH family protein [Maricaulaceae bacterium]